MDTWITILVLGSVMSRAISIILLRRILGETERVIPR